MTAEARKEVPLSVVVTSGGDPGSLRASVEAVLRAGFDASRDELLVVIDGSSAKTRSLLDELSAMPFPIRILDLPESRGPALMRLFGATQAHHDVLVLVDGDVLLEPVALQEHRRFHQQSGIPPSMLVGAVSTDVGEGSGVHDLPVQIHARDHQDTVLGWQTAPHTIAQTLRTGHLSLRRADLLAAETVMPTRRLDHFEATDLGLRLSVVGVRMHYSQRAGARRLHRQDLRTFLAEAAGRGRGAALFGRRWPTVTVGPTAPSGESAVRTVTSALFRQAWFVRAVERWLRRGSGRASASRREQILRVRDLVEQAWFDRELRHDHDRSARSVVGTAPSAEPRLTRQFANTGRRA